MYDSACMHLCYLFIFIYLCVARQVVGMRVEFRKGGHRQRNTRLRARKSERERERKRDYVCICILYIDM